MAKNVGVVGSLNGKVGNFVFRTRRGMQITSVYQPEVHNPKSKRQTLSRAKLALATSVAKPMKLLLRAGWQRTNPTYEVQQFIKRAIPVDNAIILGTDPDSLTLGYAEMAMAICANLLGSLNGLSTPSWVEEGEVSFTITPDDNLFLDSDGSEIGCGLVIGYYCPDLDQCIVKHHVLNPNESNNIRDTFSSDWSGLPVKMFVFAKQIPNAQNGITSSQLPWMYPADTTMARYFQGTIA